MEHSAHHLYKTGSHLGDRILWFDGSITVDPSNLLDFMRPNVKLHVTEMTPDVNSYNIIADTPITVKTKLDVSGILPERWIIPDQYMDIDLESYFNLLLSEWSGTERSVRQTRVNDELEAFRVADQEIVLRLMIYVIDTLNDNDCVWGIGRGSSVSCFLLYLIGVHDIDSVRFNLNFADFMKSS